MFKVKCFLFNQTGPGLTLCQNVYQDNWRQGKNWVPRCTKDGKFEPVQCHSGVCFCVDNYGVERRGSHTWALINGRPRCNEGILCFKCRSAGDVFQFIFSLFQEIEHYIYFLSLVNIHGQHAFQILVLQVDSY